MIHIKVPLGCWFLHRLGTSRINSDIKLSRRTIRLWQQGLSSIDVKSGLVLSTCVSKASGHDTNYFQHAVAKAIHGKELPTNVYADKGYCGEPNRNFLHMNNIDDGIMRKNQINAALTEYEIQRIKMISKVRYKIEQYFGITEKNTTEQVKLDLQLSWRRTGIIYPEPWHSTLKGWS